MNAGVRTGVSAFLTLRIKIGIANCLPTGCSWIKRTKMLTAV